MKEFVSIVIMFAVGIALVSCASSGYNTHTAIGKALE